MYPQLGKTAEELKIKVLLVGDSGVGKSSIRKRFCDGQFNPFSVETVGIQFSRRKFWGSLDGQQQNFTVCLWDAAGQNKGSSLIGGFFKNVIGVIYVYDITKQKTLNNIRKWRALVAEQINSLRIVEMLIGNKNDLLFLREVSISSGELLKQELKLAIFIETSALLNIGINEAFTTYLCEMVRTFSYGVKKPLIVKKKNQEARICY